MGFSTSIFGPIWATSGSSPPINPAITWEPAVGLYLDGVYIAKAQGSIFDIADLERVEILRGSNGLLHGSGNPAATVNLVRKRPTYDEMLAREPMAPWLKA